MTIEAGFPCGRRPTWLMIDRSAVVANFRLARRLVGSGVEVWPVVKADGYGLGAVAIALALQQAGADGFCVTMVEEAKILREAGITLPMAVFSGCAEGQESELAALGLLPFLFRLEDGRRLASFGRRGVPVPVWLKVDTGMGRLGFAPEEVPGVLGVLDGYPGIRVVGVVSHCACADQPERPETAWQVERLRALLAHPVLAGRGLRVSLANSAALMAHPATRFDWVRPGIMLYGASPFYPTGREEALAIRPVVRWLTRVIQVREVPEGTPLGYGHVYVTTRPSRIGQLPVGYDDGYSRILGNQAMVLINGCRVPVVGRVCMDLIAVDLTDLSGVGPGALVTLLGGDGADQITLEEMASWMETIPYEVICRLGARVPRCYTG